MTNKPPMAAEVDPLKALLTTWREDAGPRVEDSAENFPVGHDMTEWRFMLDRCADELEAALLALGERSHTTIVLAVDVPSALGERQETAELWEPFLSLAETIIKGMGGMFSDYAVQDENALDDPIAEVAQALANAYAHGKTDALAAHREGPATAETAADPIPLSREQIKHIQTWADDSRLWNTREVALFNLFTFARLMMKSADGAHSVDDALDVYAPGAWRCPKCGFALQTQTIFMQTGSIGSSRDDVMNVTGEVCPNDGVMMSRETWHDRAEANYKWGVDLMEQVIALTGAASLPAAIDTIKSLSAHREGRPPAAETEKP